MTDPEFRIERSSAGLARAAVEAAAPILAEAVSQKIIDRMEAHPPQASDSGQPGRTLLWAHRRYFRIAAQVAHFAFSTKADIARMTAEAIARGDVVVCANPEPGGTDDGH